MKKISKVLAIMLVLSMFLTACAGSTGSSSNDSGDIILRFSWWGGDERHEKTLEAIALFEEQNPGIKIEPEYSGWQGHLEKITTQIVGNTAADIMQINWNWIYSFSRDGNGFYDLSTLDAIDLSNYEDFLLEQTTVDGKVNALPVGIGGKVFYYNQTTYDKAGVEIPQTFEDLFVAAPIFKEKLGNDYYPIDLDQYGAFLMVLYYLEQKTGKPFIVDNEVAYTQAELEDGYNFYMEMVDKGVTPSMQVRAGAGDVAVDQTPSWIQGKYGGTYEWDSAVNKFLAALEGDQTMVTGEFLNDIGPHQSALNKVSMTFAINKNTKYPEAAAKFLNFLVSDPEATRILGTSRGIPANKAAEEVLLEEGLLSGLNYEGNVKVQEFAGKGISPYFEADELNSFFRAVVEELGFGIIDASTAAAKTISETNRLLAELAQ
ncbi:ABC transporter substrate-binding protein [Clostridium formicaceticum]|uniref:ABC transporter substrate-binding protein n=1 Tax=Clostridium formicaceticum TaxID=1497 RepID=A0AAC9WF32_9CLOT|nr:ABC transporter substrate-binding protein [Clostridium formicaceticum]AOY76080.1 ABC transporter substrate-binding protein [Clostridium formicaceticum]ARE86442.1 Putative ABC transporter substrate-binding protein YesO [Clostridium formicaceticum]